MSDLHMSFEIIERKGDRRFSVGNLEALFESLERDQICRRALAKEDT